MIGIRSDPLPLQNYPANLASVNENRLAIPAQYGRYVLLTGSKDFNREDTQDVYKDYSKIGFNYLKYRSSGCWMALADVGGVQRPDVKLLRPTEE